MKERLLAEIVVETCALLCSAHNTITLTLWFFKALDCWRISVLWFHFEYCESCLALFCKILSLVCHVLLSNDLQQEEKHVYPDTVWSSFIPWSLQQSQTGSEAAPVFSDGGRLHYGHGHHDCHGHHGHHATIFQKLKTILRGCTCILGRRETSLPSSSSTWHFPSVCSARPPFFKICARKVAFIQ